MSQTKLSVKQTFLRPHARFIEKFENGDFTLKNASNVLSPYYAGEVWKRNKHGSFWICGNFGHGNTSSSWHNCFRKPPFSKCLPLTFIKIESRRFRDGFEWTVGLALCGRDISFCRTTTEKTRTTTIATETCLQRLLLNWTRKKLTYEWYDLTINENNNNVIKTGSRIFHGGRLVPWVYRTSQNMW